MVQEYSGEVPQQVVDYITNNIKKGKKFPQIKEELLRARWTEEEIKWAYKETTRQNYNKYLQQSGAAPRAPSNAQRNKVIAIVAVSLFILIIATLFLGKTFGFAIYFDKLIGGEVGGTAGEITYALECTPPHILTPEETACCLDLNKNQKCDTIEQHENETVEKVTKSEKCIDYRQCRPDYCIDSKCGSLYSLYKKPLSGCYKVCNYYHMDIKTSDGEEYALRPKQGSYTGAGAIEWTVLSMPNHCIEESAVVPIQIVRKKPGKILSTEIITLQERETSAVLTNPFAPGLKFTLYVDKIYEVCAEDEMQLGLLIEKNQLLKPAIEVKG